MAKHLDLAGLTAYDKLIKEYFKAGIVDITDEAINALFTVVQPNNEIWYISNEGNVVTPYATDVFGANIVSNTYENGKGVITFDGDVTSIGQRAFKSCKSLNSMTIPNSVTSIGNMAFEQCTYLTSVTLPNSVTSIGNGAFDYCYALPFPVYNTHCFARLPASFEGTYTVPDGIKQIAGGAFSGCKSLTSVAIPNSVTSMGNGTFYECTSLTSVTIPNSITIIGSSSLSYCYALSSIVIPDSVTSIENYAFFRSTSLKYITFEGTMKEWNSITKGTRWNDDVPATYVQCSDGQVAL